jgi:hypothetical protein
MPPQQGERLLDIGNRTFGLGAHSTNLSDRAGDIGRAENKRNAV